MPSAAPRPCKHPGCGALVRDGSGYCAAHQHEAKQGKFGDRFRGSRQSRGYGSGWDKLRLVVFARDNGLCQECLRMGIITAPQGRERICDHVKPKAEGGTDDLANLQTLCLPCSIRKTADESARGRARARGEGGVQSLAPRPSGPSGSPNFYGRKF